MTKINSATHYNIQRFFCRPSLDLVEELFSSLNIIEASS